MLSYFLNNNSKEENEEEYERMNMEGIADVLNYWTRKYSKFRNDHSIHRKTPKC